MAKSTLRNYNRNGNPAIEVSDIYNTKTVYIDNAEEEAVTLELKIKVAVEYYPKFGHFNLTVAFTETMQVLEGEVSPRAHEYDSEHSEEYLIQPKEGRKGMYALQDSLIWQAISGQLPDEKIAKILHRTNDNSSFLSEISKTAVLGFAEAQQKNTSVASPAISAVPSDSKPPVTGIGRSISPLKQLPVTQKVSYQEMYDALSKAVFTLMEQGDMKRANELAKALKNKESFTIKALYEQLVKDKVIQPKADDVQQVKAARGNKQVG